jgi:hypothetical protein
MLGRPRRTKVAVDDIVVHDERGVEQLERGADPRDRLRLATAEPPRTRRSPFRGRKSFAARRVLAQLTPQLDVLRAVRDGPASRRVEELVEHANDIVVALSPHPGTADYASWIPSPKLVVLLAEDGFAHRHRRQGDRAHRGDPRCTSRSRATSRTTGARSSSPDVRWARRPGPACGPNSFCGHPGPRRGPGGGDHAARGA